ADGTSIGMPSTRGGQVTNTGEYGVEVAVNELGFRDRKSVGDATNGSLFVVGDSFAFGWGVAEDDRFSNRLETMLGQPVINIAAGAADFDGYDSLVRYAESRGARID